MGGPIIQPRSFTLWVDADAAPREVKEIVFRAAARLRLPTVLVANQRLPGDVAVTADIPLAAVLVARQVMVLDPRGEEFTPENVGERLSLRNAMDGFRM